MSLILNEDKDLIENSYNVALGAAKSLASSFKFLANKKDFLKEEQKNALSVMKLLIDASFRLYGSSEEMKLRKQQLEQQLGGRSVVDEASNDKCIEILNSRVCTKKDLIDLQKVLRGELQS